MTVWRAEPGPSDSIGDVGGLRIGSAHDAHIASGVTVIVPDAPVAMAVDVRGGGPGTRETDALNPSCLVEKVHALVLSGGSVFGLAAADEIANRLSADGIGLPLGPRAVPVVPSAILFDLKNGGDKNWGDSPPYGRLAGEAYGKLGAAVESGRFGAGYGATAGAEQGGVGSASFALQNGITVGAIVAVNSFGGRTAAAGGTDSPLGEVHLPKLGLLGANTTIAAVATNLDLTKAECERMAIMAQDGLARGINPIHTPFDGDTVFALSTGALPSNTDDLDRATALSLVGTLAADALVAAVRKAIDGAH